MSFESFLEMHAFNGDPFASTNAEKEDRLADYFVPPPYFQSVLGAAETPKTNVIFAPRGSGKTTQRLMIQREIVDAPLPILCLTYDNFATVQASSGSLTAHHAELIKLLVLGILAHLEGDKGSSTILTDRECQIVKTAAYQFLSKLSMGEYENAVQSVKSLGDKATEFWHKYGGPVAAGLALLIKKAGLDDVELSVKFESTGTAGDDNSKFYFDSLLRIARRLGYLAIYFLVDRVDETSETTADAEAAGKLIQALATNLPTLEAPDAAFKFFLWDQMRDYLMANGLRADRMEVVSLRWTPFELSKMLSRRLGTFSGNRISSFNHLLESDVTIDAHMLLVYLSHGSPRGMIRMARTIVSEHTRMGYAGKNISNTTLLRGIQLFSKDSTAESFPKLQQDFFRVDEPSFTIPGVASIFKVSTQGATNKIQGWDTAGAIQPLGTKPNPGRKPLNLYGFTDLRVVLASKHPADVELVLDNYAFLCAGCEQMIIIGESKVNCPNCGTQSDVSEAVSLLELCSQ